MKVSLILAVKGAYEQPPVKWQIPFFRSDEESGSAYEQLSLAKIRLSLPPAVGAAGRE